MRTPKIEPLDESGRAREWILFQFLRGFVIPVAVVSLLLAFLGWPALILLLIIKDVIVRSLG